MEVGCKLINAATILTALFHEFSAVTDYRTLRDSLPRRLTYLLKCRCVLFYQHSGESLQFAAGSFGDQPGWSAALLAVAHINPISASGDLPEARAWRERRSISVPDTQPLQVAVPLMYRQRAIGVLVALRGGNMQAVEEAACWYAEEIEAIEAVSGVVALLLENARLLERDRERIQELALLNSITSQINCSLYDLERLRGTVLQRAREVSRADVCVLLEQPGHAVESEWLSPDLCASLFTYFQNEKKPAPLLLERFGNGADPRAAEIHALLPTRIKTFFAYPLLRGRAVEVRGSSLPRSSRGDRRGDEKKLLGIVVGGYYQAWKLRREELVLLQVLATQAGTVLENMQLVSEVLEARNEARKLLRKVLDDQRFKALVLESMPGGLLTTNSKGCITTFNRAAENILGYHPREVLGLPLARLLDLRAIYGDSVIALEDIVRGAILACVDRQGSEVILRLDVQPLRDQGGCRIGQLVTFSDVTSMRRLEEEKQRLDRLASLGEMAANVAHEVRNPLASIKTSMHLLKDELTSEPEQMQVDWAQESITVVLKEVERLDAIVRDLLLFARPRRLHRVCCDLADVSDRVLKLLQTQLAEAGIGVHRIYEPLPSIWVDAAQIEQILLNLFMNALQAMPDGGVLSVAFRPIAAEDPEDGRGWIEIVVSDTGVGIEAAQIERIFQPFFTTKAHGIGLGLPITRRLIEDHGGYIRVEGQFGYGTSMVVHLPMINVQEEDLLDEHSYFDHR